jgi:tRNA (mo5U34)-methyltransferase
MQQPTVRYEIEQLGPWFHNLHLPDGTQTCPEHFLGDFPSFKWKIIAPHIPERLDGWTALDIGCNAGFYSFELAKRGARVTAIDHDEHYLRQAHWAAGQYGLSERITFRQEDVYDLARSEGSFDLVMFMGVLYHLRYPLLGIDIVSRKVGKLMVFQSLTMPGEEAVEPPANLPLDERERLAEPGWPKMAFIERRMASDPTNWWAPNHACLEAMLRSSGLAVRSRPGHEIFVCEPDPASEVSAWTWNENEYLAAIGQRRKGPPRAV